MNWERHNSVNSRNDEVYFNNSMDTPMSKNEEFLNVNANGTIP